MTLRRIEGLFAAYHAEIKLPLRRMLLTFTAIKAEIACPISMNARNGQPSLGITPS